MTATDPLMEQARDWAAAGLKVALVTVVDTWGSSPCPPGSRMVVNEKAEFQGSVSGGCIETSVISESLEALAEDAHELLEFGVSDEVSFEAGLACGGTVHVLTEPLDRRLLEALSGAPPLVRLIDLESGAGAVLRGDSVSGALSAPDAVVAEARAALARGGARVVEEEGRRYFLHPMLPAYRLVVVGAVRIAQALGPMAAEAGFDVTVVDPRPAFATHARFPGAKLIRQWPDRAFADLDPDSRTAVVTLIHDAQPDDMALGLAIRSKAFYVGALGSRRTHAKRVARLKEQGYTENEIARIQAPIGLDIGARTPAEIAVAILAQVIAAKNRPGGGQ